MGSAAMSGGGGGGSAATRGTGGPSGATRGRGTPPVETDRADHLDVWTLLSDIEQKAGALYDYYRPHNPDTGEPVPDDALAALHDADEALDRFLTELEERSYPAVTRDELDWPEGS